MQKPFYKQVWFWICAAVVVLAIGYAIYSNVQRNKAQKDLEAEKNNIGKYDAVKEANNEFYEKLSVKIDATNARIARIDTSIANTQRKTQTIINNYKGIYEKIDNAPADSNIAIALQLLSANRDLPLERK